MLNRLENCSTCLGQNSMQKPQPLHLSSRICTIPIVVWISSESKGTRHKTIRTFLEFKRRLDDIFRGKRINYSKNREQVKL